MAAFGASAAAIVVPDAELTSGTPSVPAETDDEEVELVLGIVLGIAHLLGFVA